MPPAPGELPRPPALRLMTQLDIAVGAAVSLGAPARHGERRYVPLGSGHARGPELNGTLLEGGIDWQVQRADGATDISAHYVIRTDDGALVEVQSDGIRHGPPEVMAALLRGDVVPPDAYYFRTVLRLTTGHPDWLHLNKLLAIGVGRREAARVQLDVWRIA